MIITHNGFISFLYGEPGVRIDSYGNPVSGERSWGELIPCNIAINKRDYSRKIDFNPFPEESYKVLFTTPPTPFTTSRRVQLFDADGERIGEYPVKDCERLYHVNAIQVIV